MNLIIRLACVVLLLSQAARAAEPYSTSDGRTLGGSMLEWQDDSGFAVPASKAKPVPAMLVPTAGQGCSPYHKANGTTASNNATNIKVGAGTLCHLLPSNPTGTNAFLKIYDTAGVPSCNSITGLVHVYQIFGNANGTGGGFVLPLPLGEAFTNGIGYCVVGGNSDTDNSNAPAGVLVEASYK